MFVGFYRLESKNSHKNSPRQRKKERKKESRMATPTTGGGGGGGGGEQQKQHTPQHKQTVLDLGKYIDKGVRVKLSGGREVEGILKGFDQLLNLVLDETKEYLRDVDDPLRITDETRKLGLIVTRGTSVMVVSPLDGLKEIENPFAAAEEY
jgi:U6 snRNA-associated Sm-like protein LSm7